MKELRTLLLHSIWVFLGSIQAQTLSADEILFMKTTQKMMYAHMYAHDSLSSKEFLPKETFPWENIASVDSKIELENLKNSLYIDIRGRKQLNIKGEFSKGITKDQCRFFTSKLISYSLKNEQNIDVVLDTSHNRAYCGPYMRNNVLERYLYFYDLNIQTAFETHLMGHIDFEISAPISMASMKITSQSVGQTVKIKNDDYVVLAFKKDHVVLQPLANPKPKDFDFFGTNVKGQRLEKKAVKSKYGTSRAGQSYSVMPKAIYDHFNKNPHLTEKDLDVFLDQYYEHNKAMPTHNQNDVLILKDLGKVDQIYVFWPSQRNTISVSLSINFEIKN